MAIKKEMVRSGSREIWGILLIAFCALVFLAQVSYDPGDIRFIQDPPNQPALNYIGPTGAWLSYLLFAGFGVAGYLTPLLLAVSAALLLVRREGRLWPQFLWLLATFISLIAIIELQGSTWDGVVGRLNTVAPGGIVGYVLITLGLAGLMGTVGTGILAVAVLLTGLVFLSGIHPMVVIRQLGAWSAMGLAWIREKNAARKDRETLLDDEAKSVAKRRQRLEDAMRKRDAALTAAKTSADTKAARAKEPVRDQELLAEVKDLPPTKSAGEKTERPPKPAPRQAPPPEPVTPLGASGASDSGYRLPPLDLLAPPRKRDLDIPEDHQAAATILQDTLAEFGVEAQVTNVEKGPVVTRYELLPAPGVRVERIAALANNLALVMKAESVRVQAPIPGKGVVGIEVPNSKSTFVFLREMMESNAWKPEKLALPLALGKDVGGHALVADLADMPHLLIAGATGSGKTVCMNSILAGLLMSRTPDQMRLMLIDPKIVEFSGYDRLPHLVVPVITDAKKVSLGLRWAINEMEKRYKLFAKVGVRNIKSYNTRPIVKQPDLFADVSDGEEVDKPDLPPDRIPYIVVIVDELADLMLVAQAEIENSIARLAQLSRAVGIHMILATQRPSVNVITGTIKANFPARIAFQVAQKVDSRTILDAAGADKLLGKGDMLFLPPGSSKLIRAQGSMTSDDEIRQIVEFIRSQGGPQYEGAIKEKLESRAALLPEMEEDDDMLEAAIEVIRQTQRASTSSLQRRLRIGYTRAARLMDLLEERGMIGPPQGSEPREILIDLDGEIPQNVTDDELENPMQ